MRTGRTSSPEGVGGGAAYLDDFFFRPVERGEGAREDCDMIGTAFGRGDSAIVAPAASMAEGRVNEGEHWGSRRARLAVKVGKGEERGEKRRERGG